MTSISQLAANAPGIWESAAERSDRLQRSAAASETERTEQAPGSASMSGRAQANMDLFVHGKESESAGLYQVSKDEEGNLQIIFDADDSDNQQEMQTRLQQIERELRVKDTDAYRNAHTVITPKGL